MSIYSIGVSGMNAAQVALAAAGNNIANVYTPGYNREVVQLSSNLQGSGVDVSATARQFSQFISSQLNQAVSRESALTSYQSQIGQIDSLMADNTAGLAPLVQEFFSAIQDVVSTPSDPAARQGLIGSAETLAGQFRAFGSYFEEMRTAINNQIKDQVTQVNNIATQLADVNKQITLVKGKSSEEPNGLLNERDRLISELSGYVDTKVVKQDGESYNVSIGDGLSLVSGSTSFKLAALPASADPTRVVIGYRDSLGNIVELGEDNFNNGELGGVLSFRSEALDEVQNQLGQLAASLAMAMNEVHQKGINLDNEIGQAMFSVGSPQSFRNRNNESDAYLAVEFNVDKRADLAATDYEVVYSPDNQNATAGFVVRRTDSGAQVTPTLSTNAEGNSVLEFGGLTVTVKGTVAAGDSFRVQPLRNAAAGLESLIKEVDKIAAAKQASSPGDNSNALDLLALQEDVTVVAGGGTISQAYAGMIGNIGNRTNIVNSNLSAQTGLVEQLSSVQQSESGVSLNEEGANLMRYQRYFQANAKLIEVATNVFDSLLAIR